MTRAHERRPVGLKALLIGILMIVGALVAAFSFVGPELLAGRLPLGITRTEMDAYARWFDRRPGSDAQGTLTHFEGQFRAEADGKDLLRVGDREGQVEHRAVADVYGAVELRTNTSGLLGPDPWVVLRPATPEDLRHKFLQVIAEELGLLTPEVSFVEFSADDLPTAVHRKDPVIDATWLTRHGVSDGVVTVMGFDPQRPDHFLPTFEAGEAVSRSIRERLALACAQGVPAPPAVLADLVERDQVAAWLLMLHLEGHPDPLRHRHTFAWRETSGRLMPIYRPTPESSAVSDAPLACDPFTPLLADPAFRAIMQAQRDKLLEARGRIRERCVALIDAFAPLLAGNGSERLAVARAKAMLAVLLDERLGAPLDTGALRRPMVPPVGQATLMPAGGSTLPVSAREDSDELLAAIKRRFRVVAQGDSILFPRGRYVVEEDLILPAGHRVVLLPGARFEIAPGRNVLCRGPLEVRGTALNPVFIRPQRTGAPFGTFAVRGDGLCDIAGLRMSGGMGGTMEGIAYPAMLTIVGMTRTVLSSCELSGEGHDALYIEGGRVHLEGGSVLGGTAVLRNTQGAVVATRFESKGSPGGAGGLSISGGRLLLDAPLFQGLKDVALLADAGAQVLVRSAVFTRNATAIQVGTLSAVHVSDCRFDANTLVFHVPEADGGPVGRLHRYANTLTGDQREVDAPGEGSVVVSDRPDAFVLRAFGAE